MKITKIGFTKKEYRALLEMLGIADWVLHAHFADEPEDRKSYRDLQQRISSFAETFGCGHLIEYDPRLMRYYGTREFEEVYLQFIEEFEDESFWQDLAARLAERDTARRIDVEKWTLMDRMDRLKEIDRDEEKYWEEFEANGLDRLEIVGGAEDQAPDTTPPPGS